MHRPAWKSLFFTAGLAAQLACGGPLPDAPESLEQTEGSALTASPIQRMDMTSLLKQRDITALVSSGGGMTLAAAPPLQYPVRVYDYSAGDSAKSVIQTSDGGYVFAGSTTAFGDEDFLLVKTDAALNVQWASAYGTSSSDSGVSVRATSDGGFVVAGTTFVNNNYDFYLVKTDSVGNPQWAATYGNANQDYAAGMEVTPDGGFIIVGRTQTNVGYQDALMLKLSSAGAVQWSRVYSSSAAGTYEFDGVANVPNGGYIAVGSRQVAVSGGWETYGYAVKVSSTGGTVFQSTVGRFATFSSVAATSTGYVAAGYIFSPGSSAGADYFISRLGTAGSLLWSRTYSGGTSGDYLNDVKATADGNYVMTGVINPTLSKQSLSIMKLDSSGAQLWSSVMDFGTASGGGQGLAVTSDGGFIVTGSYSVSGNSDALLAKFSP